MTGVQTCALPICSGGSGGSSGGSGGSSGGSGDGTGGTGDGGVGAGDGGGGVGAGDGLAKGGMVTAKNLSGPDPVGPDDGYVPLDKGEFVLTAEAVRKLGPIGIEVLKRLNANDKK